MTVRMTGFSNFLMFQRMITERNANMFEASERISSQKRINRSSDDPEGKKLILGFRDTLERAEQFEANIGLAKRQLTQAESALTDVNSALVRAYEKAIEGNNGIKSAQEREAIANEIHQIAQNVLNLANTQINGEYIFSGFRTDTRPFSLDASYPNATPAATFSGDGTNLKSIQINESGSVTIQINGEDTFLGDGTPATVDIFQSLANLETALRTGDLDASSATGVPAMIANLKTAQTQVLNEITSIGARTNRLDTAKEQLAVQKETLKTFIEDVEGVDFAEVTMEFQRAQLAMQGTISAAGNILNLPSLMDFLR